MIRLRGAKFYGPLMLREFVINQALEKAWLIRGKEALARHQAA